MRRAVGGLLLLLIMGTAAWAVGEDSQAQYVNAKALLDQCAYRQAYESFEALEGYEDSALYAQYVLALYSVDHACWDRAEALWITLSQRAFLDSEDWLTYTRARRWEEAGNRVAAAALYARTPVADAAGRLAALETDWRKEAPNAEIAPPVLRAAEDGAQGPILRWDGVPGAEGYAIFRGEGDGQDLRSIAVVAEGATDYADQEARAGVCYRYGVKALMGDEASAMSNVLEAEKACEPSPTSLTLAAGDAATLEASWEGPDSEAGYAVYATVAGQERAVGGTSCTRRYSYVIGDLVPGTAYTVYVQNKDGGNFLSAQATLAEAPNFREYAYRWQLCRVVRQTLNNGQPRWEGASRMTRAELAQAETLGVFGLQLKCSWEKCSEEKQLELCLVLRTPAGDVLARRSEVRYAGEETTLYTVFSLEDLLRDAATKDGDWEPGEYRCEIYLNSGFAGRAAFDLQ